MSGDTRSCDFFPRRLPVLRRMGIMLCAGLAWTAFNIYSGDLLSPVSQAHAQSMDFPTQAMFLAVDKNDLPGVRAAIDGGADIEARDYTGMQSVDLAIDRGYFDIAHYLISVRNQHRATAGTPVQPAPSPKQLAEAAQAARPQPTASSGLALPKGAPDPFRTPPSGTGLPIVGEITPPAGEAPSPLEKPSASRKFVSTFLDFFKPPNTTGISRNKRKTRPHFKTAPLETKQLKELASKRGTVTPNPTLTPPPLATTPPTPQTRPVLPRVQGTPESIQKRIAAAEAAAQPPATSDTPAPDAFADVQFGEAPPAGTQKTAPPAIDPLAPLDPSLPFGGRVDPDILALVNEAPAQADPFALSQDAQAPSDPFALPADPPADTAQSSASNESVAGLLEGLGAAQDVPAVDTKRPPPPDNTTADPFATPADTAPADTGGGTSDLAGLLDTSNAQSGWDVKAVEGNGIPNEVVLLDTIEPTGKVLDNVELTLGTDTMIGQEVGAERLKLLKEDTIHRPCLTKGGPDTLFCVDQVNWPQNLKDIFLVDTIMYQGTRTIARYDAGRATNFHALFNASSFASVVNYYIEKYGQPTQVVQRAIAPLAQPRTDNPTYIWQSREAGTDTITTMEIRKFDDARGSFPDTKRGVILLYLNHSQTIFPQLSQLELMVLKAKGEAASFAAPAPVTPDAVW